MKFLDLNSYQYYQCITQANLFRLAWEKGYRMAQFFPAFMNSAVAEALDSSYHRMQWSGEAYALETLVRECLLFPEIKPEPRNPEAIYWAGWIYRYWNFWTGESSRAIFATAGFPYILEVYAGYHTFINPEHAILRMQQNAHTLREKEISAA